MRLFRWNQSPADEPDPPFPWQGLPPIAAFLETWDGKVPLPDEAEQEEGQIRFAPGAFDGILSHHSAEEEGGKREHQIARLFDLVECAVLRNDDKDRAALYRAVQEDEALRLSDELSDAIAHQKHFGPHQLYCLASWLHDHAAHRGPFKIALVLMGLCGHETDLPLLVQAARHPEFTLYALVAASNIAPDPTPIWWDMAREADGWGKIHLIERLAPLAYNRVDLQQWLLRKGCANSVMDEYLAWQCAHYGDLRGALERGEHDDALLDGAGRILMALTIGGPTQDMSDYADGSAATRLYLEALETRCDSVWRLFVVTALDRFLARLGGPAMEGAPNWRDLGWTPDVVSELRALCGAIMTQPEWPGRLEHDVASNGYYWAWDCAQYLGLDLWDSLFSRLKREPLNANIYNCLLKDQSAPRKQRVAEFARAHLPLQQITSNSQQSAFTTDPASFCLDVVVWAMNSEDGENFFDAALVEAALRAPATRTRNAAVTALENWPRVQWGATLEATVRQRQRDEPDRDVFKRLKAL